MAKIEPIAVGILGYGRAGCSMQTNELKAHEGKFRIAAVCDILPARREKAAAAHGCKTYATIGELLADPEIELVCVATRSCDHFKHAMMALKANKLVFQEKPMCMTFAEAKKLRAEAAKHHDALFIRHNRRFEPLFQHIREIIASRILGDVFEIKLRRNSYARRDDWQTIRQFGGGQLLNWGPHIIDHALQFLGTPPVDVWGDLKKTAAAGDSEDHLKIVMKNEKGLVVDLEISGGSAIGEPEYLVSGTKGALKASGKTITLRYWDPKVKPVKRVASPQTPETGFGSKDNLAWIDQEIEVAPKLKCNMASIWGCLFDTIRKGKPFPISLDEAVAVMEVVSFVKKGTPFEA
ncbi:MAG: Gfo/Idh/MocA family oxidoreductase [Kiritimatiellia bacterium]